MDVQQRDQPLHSVSVAGVILDAAEENVLLIRRRDNGHWEPPGGVLELNETIEAGLVREIREETGLHVDVDRLTGVYKNMSRGIIALVFRCHTHGKPAISTPEAIDIAWQPLARVNELMTSAYSIRVNDAAAGNDVRTRAHDGARLIDFSRDERDRPTYSQEATQRLRRSTNAHVYTRGS